MVIIRLTSSILISHYLQLAASNRSSSLARSVFQSGTFAGGGAVYVTQVMMDEGYGADDPALLFCHWKYYLRAIVNTLLDIGVHVEGMGEDEAMRLMIGGAFQEEQEARGLAPGAASRGRLRRAPGLRPAHPPGGGHLARHAAHPMGPPDPLRYGIGAVIAELRGAVFHGPRPPLPGQPPRLPPP